MSSTTILYFSNHCDSCLMLFEYLNQNKGLFDLFDLFVCIDNYNKNGVIDEIPSHVKCVPLITTPEYNEPLEGSAIINWFDYKIKMTDNNEDHVPILTSRGGGERDTTLPSIDELMKQREMEDMELRG